MSCIYSTGCSDLIALLCGWCAVLLLSVYIVVDCQYMDVE